MKSLIVANWKMNPGSWKEAKKLFEETKRMVGLTKGLSIIVAPPSIFVRDIASLQSPKKGKSGKVGLAAQHVHFERSGSLTGEISIPQVQDAKATHALVGHAERRAMGETDLDVAKKIKVLLEAKMTPIVCIGEKERTPEGEHFTFVREQLRVGLQFVSPAQIGKIIIAYEPVWAIGAAKPMQPRDMHEMSIFIRKMLVEKYGTLAMNIAVLYGGAIDASNAAPMLRDGDVKGFLVGRASVDAKSFVELLRAVHEA